MISDCPFCKKQVEGSPINKRESSILRSTYKFYSSLVLLIPFVGSYIGGKIYDLFCSPEEWYHRFVCPTCRCSWIATENHPIQKTGGNKSLVTIFIEDSFVIGLVEHGLYMVQTVIDNKISNTVVSKDGDNLQVSKYINGSSESTNKFFKRVKIDEGLFVGETFDNVPNGWGILFQQDGFMWYGKWKNGKRNGIGGSCDFDGSECKVGIWKNDTMVV
jgi:hypothetical protein